MRKPAKISPEARSNPEADRAATKMKRIPSASEQALEYIRNQYKVPAYVGLTVIIPGDSPARERAGNIIGASGPHLLVDLFNVRRTAVVHPTWEMVYLPGGQPPLSFRTCDQQKAEAQSCQ